MSIWKDYYEYQERRGNGNFAMGLFLWVLTDPMAIERREIDGKFQELASNPRALGFQLDRDIQVSILIFILVLKINILKHIILDISI